MARHILSVVTALFTSGVALLLLWSAGGALSRSVGAFSGEAPPLVGAWVALGAGMLVLLVGVGAAVALSPWGAIALGAPLLLVGAVALLWPWDPSSDLDSPVWTVVSWFSSIWRETGYGVTYFLATGVGATLGAVLLGGGIGALGRGATRRLLAGIVGSVLLVAGILVTIVHGSRSFRALVERFEPDPGTMALVVLAALVAGAGAAGVRWTAVPTIVVGALTTIAGIAGLVAPAGLLEVPGGIGFDLYRSASTGLVLILGLVVLALGAGVAVHRHAQDAAGAREAVVGGSQGIG